MLPKQYPSIRSWIITVSVATCLYMICAVLENKYAAAVVYKRHTLETNYLLEHALENIDRNPEKIQVVALGSSLVGHGIACAAEDEVAYQDVCLSKIFLNSNTEILKTFTDAGVFDSLLIHVPDILLIEVDQLAYKVEEETTLKDHFFKGAYFLYNLKTALAMQTGKYRMPEYCGKIIPGTLSDTSMYAYVKRKSLTLNDRKYVHSKLKQLSDRGVKIYLIHIPRPSVTEAVLHHGKQEQLFLDLMNTYQKEFKITYKSFPGKLGFQYFYDYGHLNDLGRKKYSDWLYGNIIKAKE